MKISKNNFFLFLGLFVFLYACQQNEPKETSVQLQKETVKTSRHPEWLKNANIYEVNIRQYTPEGTFKAFEAHLPRLKEMGVDILWFMPIQPVGVKNRKGSLGSYYSISNYNEVNPEFGTINDFNRVVELAHEMGMKVVLDWVANHTAWDHHWVRERPDFYTGYDEGNYPQVPSDNDGKPTDWTDVADLNYNNPYTKMAMTEAMRNWIITSNIDGFRCDVAGFVPLEEWKYIAFELRTQKPTLLMLAEWEDPEYMQVFNMDYGWHMHHIMNKVAKGEEPASALAHYLDTLRTKFTNDDMKMFFTDNHDENSWNGTVSERMGDNHLPMFVLAATFQNGMPLIYSGQEAGLDKRLRFFDKDTIKWERTDLIPFYTQALALKKQNEALWNGAFGGLQAPIKTDAEDRILAYYRQKNENTVVVYLNFSSQPWQGKLPTELSGNFKNYFTGQDFDGNITLPGHGFLVLTQ